MVREMNGSWGVGLVAFDRLFAMLWKCMEIGAWLVVLGFALWIAYRWCRT